MVTAQRTFRREFKATLQGGAGKGKISEKPNNVDVLYNWRRTSKKGKIDNGENLDSTSCSVVQLEESASNANTLNIESISKSENSVKSSIVIASSSEISSADENERKLDTILSEISKLNSKLSEKINPRKQANELTKSGEYSDKLINQLNNCKIIADLYKSLDLFLHFPGRITCL